MSRIEKAIEKATKLRDSKSDETQSRKTETSRPPVIATEQVTEKIACEINRANIDPHVVAIHEPDSPIAEEYRKLISSIVRMNKRQKSFRNVLVITSSIGGEGKSMTAVNLAITMAQNYEHTVLLIDADVRRPSIHKYLNIKPGAGLCECINDGIDVGSTFMETGLGKMKFMTSGKHPGNPIELFSSKKMRDIIDELKHRYADRYIIIDTPPVLPFSETRMLCSLADGVIFVVKDGLTTLRNIEESMEVLDDSTVLGIVYNHVSMESVSESYHYDYYSDYSRIKMGN